jgi:hypothetical protein
MGSLVYTSTDVLNASIQVAQLVQDTLKILTNASTFETLFIVLPAVSQGAQLSANLTSEMAAMSAQIPYATAQISIRAINATATAV